MQGTPGTMQQAPHYEDVMAEICAFLAEAIDRARAAGIPEDRVIVDPGIGFGKTVEHNLTILARLPALASLPAPVLLGTSRKTFIGSILNIDIENRLEGTLATLARAIDGGAAILRVHDVAAARRFVEVYLACKNVVFR